MRTSVLLPLLVSILTLSSGCSNTPIVNPEQLKPILLENEQAISQSEQLLLEAEAKYEEAVNFELNFYSPSNMTKATQSIDLARDYELKGQQDDSYAASHKALSLLDRANKNRTQVEKNLQPLLHQKRVLEALNCPIVLPAKYTKQLGNIKALINNIETSNRLISDVEILSFVNDLKQLELDTLLAIHWKPANNTLKKAKKEHADINAPASYLAAKKLVAQTKIDISNNINNRERVASAGIKALRASQHALYLARDAELLDKLNKTQAENAVLDMEVLLQKIRIALKMDDIRHMSLLDQANAIAQAAETQASRLVAPLQNRILELEKQQTLTQPFSTPKPNIEQE